MTLQTAHKKRVLLISHDVISSNMAGPGIRFLELARVLRQEFKVVLATPNDCELQEQDIYIHPYRYHDWQMLKGATDNIDLIVASGFTLHMFPAICDVELPFVIDLYDPFPLENLYLFEENDLSKQQHVHLTDMNIVDVMCQRGDFFICANARQRDWWLGVLQAKGRINFPIVNQDPSLHHLIAEVPFGLPGHPFKKNGPGPKDTLPTLSSDDKLILWGGGLWNWLDPITLIQAMPSLLAKEPRAKLLFPGTRHPNSAVPLMKRTEEAIALAKQLNLFDKSVLFGDWVPYDEWQNYLADADVAVSLHFETVETQFAAVRSRVLSYIWARLPMVVTEGDAASHLIAQHQLGEVIPYRDVNATSNALLKVLSQDATDYSTHFDHLISELTWAKAAEALINFCRSPYRAPDKSAEWLAGITQQMSIETQNKQLQQQAKQLAHKEQKIVEQQHYLIEQEQRLKRLEQLVQGYEQGKFMTLMRNVDQLKRKILRA